MIENVGEVRMDETDEAAQEIEADVLLSEHQQSTGYISVLHRLC
jgi:hypothetical protein